MYNSVVVSADEETVYLTVSSTRFVLSDGLFEVSRVIFVQEGPVNKKMKLFTDYFSKDDI